MIATSAWQSSGRRLAVGFVLAALGGTPFAQAGGPYEAGFPTDSGFFPIGVWLQSPGNAGEFIAAGINTFVGLWNGPTEAQLAALSRYKIYVIAEQNDVGLTSSNAGLIRAWMQPDEPDNAQSRIPGLGPFFPCIPPATVASRSAAIKARDRSRPVLINFGRGVADPDWRGRGTCTGDLSYYDKAIAGADILSFDVYPVASDTPDMKGKLDYVARGVVNLVRRASAGQQVWAVIETSALDPARPVEPAEVRSEVWMALIHGARGIVYFVHEFAPAPREDGIFRHPDVVAEVTEINRTIMSLASVLNGADAGRRVTVSSSTSIDTLTRIQGDSLYLFAIEMESRPSIARLSIAGLNDGEAVAIGENRRVAIRNGVLEDRFTAYGVNLYKIPLAARVAP
jgi:hypothetical protein